MRAIVDGLKKYIEEDCTRMHMPGHKGKHTDEILKEVYKYDVTEVDGTDNLHKPEEMILKSENNASKIFKTIKTLYSVNGTTAGMHAAIMGTLNPGEEILVQRDCHRSVYNACMLGRLKVNWIYPKYSDEIGVSLGIDYKELEKKIIENDKIKAIVITYPSYYGICGNIEDISRIAKKYDKILIVDEAHGSHLNFSSLLPNSSINFGADIVVQSLHKTLPALTQTSMLHINSNKVDSFKIENMMSIHQTTSPSYLLMSSIDIAIDYMEKEGEKELKRIIKEIESSKEKLLENKIFVLNKSEIKDKNIEIDKTRFVVGMYNLGLTGTKLEEVLRKEYKIQAEMSCERYVVFILTVSDTNEDIKYITNSLIDISKRYGKQKLEPKQSLKYVDIKSKMSIEEAFYAKKENIEIQEAKNRISGDFIIPYPPGIPLVCPGEEINEEVLFYVRTCFELGINVIGIKNNKIEVVKQEEF